MHADRIKATTTCLKAAAGELARRGLVLAATLSANKQPLFPDAHDYLGVRPHQGTLAQPPLAPSSCYVDPNSTVGSSDGSGNNSSILEVTHSSLSSNRERIAVFGVTDPGYTSRYWTALVSLGCKTADRTDLYLLVHSTPTTSSPSLNGSVSEDATYLTSTPAILRAAGLQYLTVDFTAAFAGSTYHSAWPSVAYWWTAGPEIFGAAGYARCVYIDGDILAATPMPPPTRIKTSGSSSDRLLRTELTPILDIKPRAGPNLNAPASASPEPRLIAGALESSLGIMLAALGASDHDYALHNSTFGVSAQRLFFERLTINTGVLAFDCRVAHQRALFLDTVRLAWRCADAGLVLYGDMHVFGLLLLLAHGGVDNDNSISRSHSSNLNVNVDGREAKRRSGGGLGPADWIAFDGSSSRSTSRSSSGAGSNNRGGKDNADDVSMVHRNSKEYADSLLDQEVSKRVANRAVLAPLSAAWNFRFNRNSAAVVLKADGQISFEYGRGFDAPTQLATAAAYGQPNGGYLMSRKDGDENTMVQPSSSDGWLRLAHFTWAKPWQALEETDVQVWTYERIALAERWHIYDELYSDLQENSSDAAEPNSDGIGHEDISSEISGRYSSDSLDSMSSLTAAWVANETHTENNGVKVRITLVSKVNGDDQRSAIESSAQNLGQNVEPERNLLRVDVELEVTEGSAAEVVRAAGLSRLRICRAYTYHSTTALGVAASPIALGEDLPYLRSEPDRDALRGLSCTGLADQGSGVLPPLNLEPWPTHLVSPASAPIHGITDGVRHTRSKRSGSNNGEPAGSPEAGCIKSASVHAWLEVLAHEPPSHGIPETDGKSNRVLAIDNENMCLGE